MSGMSEERGRVNQKRRTRTAIIAACQELIMAGADINMPAVARAALVSEPTAYRYFPDLASLLEEALAGIEPDPAAALAAGADPGDPVARVAYAAELLAKLVIERQSAIRALISVSIARGTARQMRPGYRFGLIDQALAPLTASHPALMRQHSSSCGATSLSSSAPRPSSPSPTSTGWTRTRRSRASCTPRDSSPKRP